MLKDMKTQKLNSSFYLRLINALSQSQVVPPFCFPIKIQSCL